ncbi:MAG TPA: hypothetical protein VKA23_06050, partial [Mariprofundaceae bacterium]|nr:hypothetical protein [Mariprofundaceae bacterium]
MTLNLPSALHEQSLSRKSICGLFPFAINRFSLKHQEKMRETRPDPDTVFAHSIVCLLVCMFFLQGCSDNDTQFEHVSEGDIVQSETDEGFNYRQNLQENTMSQSIINEISAIRKNDSSPILNIGTELILSHFPIGMSKE